MQIYFQRIPFTLLLNTVVKCSFFDYILVENIFFFFSAQYVYLWRIFIRVQLAQRLKYKDSLLFHVVERCRKKQTRIKQAKGEQFQLNRTFSFASGDNNASFEKKNNIKHLAHICTSEYVSKTIYICATHKTTFYLCLGWMQVIW